MKNGKLMLAFTLCLSVIISCNYLNTKQMASNPLLGKWKVDSVVSKDNNDLGLLLLGMALQNNDSMLYDVAFSKDSMTILLKDSISKTAYSIDVDKQNLILVDDSATIKYNNTNDNLLTLLTKDSTTIFLKKK